MDVGGTLVWPMVVVLGFLALTAVVIALAASSTARYEFERNSVRAPRPSAAAHPAGRRPAGRPEGTSRTQAGAVAVQATAPTLDGHSGSGWWLVGEAEDGGALRPVAGPFRDRLDADWTVLACGLRAVAVFGTLRADGALAPRTSPQERAWLGELGEHLDRLPEEWDTLLTDTDPLTTLVVEVVAALVEAGLPLHDGAHRSPGGGVCLIPDPAAQAILVSWRTHDRMSVQQERGLAADAAVQQVMNTAVADVLAQCAFAVRPLDAAGGHLVSAVRS